MTIESKKDFPPIYSRRNQPTPLCSNNAAFGCSRRATASLPQPKPPQRLFPPIRISHFHSISSISNLPINVIWVAFGRKVLSSALNRKQFSDNWIIIVLRSTIYLKYRKTGGKFGHCSNWNRAAVHPLLDHS
jgi:hypothetical protein